MKVVDILESIEESKPITPNVTYRQSGDGSWTVRVDYGDSRVYVHTNKKKSELEKIVKNRYGPKVFHN